MQTPITPKPQLIFGTGNGKFKKEEKWRQVLPLLSEMLKSTKQGQSHLVTRAEAGSGRVAPAGDTARQFVVDRIPVLATPPGYIDCRDLLLDFLPMCIWVDPKPIEAITYGCPRCDVIYQVVPEAIHEFRRVTKIRVAMNTYVCTCQGHFIE